MIELDIKIQKNVKEVLSQIQTYLSNDQVEIKQIKRPKKEEVDDDGETIHLVGHYNRRTLKKNELLSNITSIENVKEVLEEES